MPQQTKDELKILSTCSSCGSKNVDMICVPGGWMRLVCRACHNEWWVENKLKLP
ncbi:MAG TPA: hypothetical protein VFK89_05025 [Actinomycetota bacterium]|nr:hypothetical protein [Actinomycetota bacterium]